MQNSLYLISVFFYQIERFELNAPLDQVYVSNNEKGNTSRQVYIDLSAQEIRYLIS